MSELGTADRGELGKRRLGRGLSSLLGAKLEQEITTPPPPARSEAIALESAPAAPVAQPLAEPAPLDPTKRLWNIPVERLAPNPNQPRKDFQAAQLAELAASIREQGILQPIVARRISDLEYEIVAGERRWRAAQLAGLTEVPVILKEVDQRSSLELAILENIQRQDLNAMEEAEAFQRLALEHAYTQAKIADRLGRERSSVANTMRLLGLAGPVQKMIRESRISAGHAKVLAAVDDSLEQISLAEQIARDGLSVRATEKLVQRHRSADPAERTGEPAIAGAVSAPEDRAIDSLQSELTKLLGTKTVIDYRGGKGRLTIHFYSNDQLEQLVNGLRRAGRKP